MESYKNIIKATSLFGGVHGLNSALDLVRSKIAAELLGPAGTGLNTIYNETRELLHSTSNLGLDLSGIRNISRRYEEWRNSKEVAEREQNKELLLDEIALLRSWIFLLASIGTLLCMVLAEPLSYFTFQDLDHILGFVLLSPAVGLSTIVCGEMIVLKATRRIKLVASITLAFVILAILVTLPFYYFFGINGVLPALVMLCLSEALLVISFSFRRYKPRFFFKTEKLKAGFPILKLGIAFALAGMLTHGTQLAIRAFFNHEGGLILVGLYGAGYSIFMKLCNIAFASVDSDYFPRLSGIFNNLEERRATVYRQIRVTVPISLLIAAITIPLLPYLLPLLNTEEYMPAVRMAQFAIASIVFRAIYLPFSYLTLAAGTSRIFLFLEFLSNVIIVACIYTCYQFWQLDGVGIGLLLAQIIDTVISFFVAKFKFNI
ncbi:MAG: oligosaccharide flippase family protein [Bacteroidales bacterium]|nr:oligosaccharide flippase family protein [Bacteroidales bacterium]